MTLRASLSAAPDAKRTVAEVLELRGVPDVAFVAQLLTNELVSNVLRHARLEAGETFLLSLDCSGETLRVEVEDPGPGFLPPSLLRRQTRSESNHHGLTS